MGRRYSRAEDDPVAENPAFTIDHQRRKYHPTLKNGGARRCREHQSVHRRGFVGADETLVVGLRQVDNVAQLPNLPAS